MHQLMATIVALALTAAALVSSISYVNPSKFIVKELGMRIEHGYADLKRSFDAFVAQNGVQPSVLGEITPAYGFVPAAPEGMGWSFGVGGEADVGRWFCLAGNASRETLAALDRLHSVLSPQAYFVNGACGALENDPPAQDANGRANVAATYWVSSYIQG